MLNLTSELIEAKKKMSKLDTELSRKNEESKLALEGERSMYHQNVDKASTVKNLEIETINVRSLIAVRLINNYIGWTH